MKQKRYTEEQIIGFLKAHEAAVKVAELIREHGFSEQSFYRWKSKYGGMEVSEAKRLREDDQQSDVFVEPKARCETAFYPAR